MDQIKPAPIQAIAAVRAARNHGLSKEEMFRFFPNADFALLEEIWIDEVCKPDPRPGR